MAHLTRRSLAASALALGAASAPAHAQTPVLSATTNQADRRSALDFMRGAPPPPEARVDETNWQNWPQAKWSVRHMRELFASRDASPRSMRAHALASAPRSFDAVRLQTDDGSMGWEEFLGATHTDAALVMIDGRIVYERYFDGMSAGDPHILFSAT